MHVSLQESLLFSLLFLFGREQHHTHQKYLNFLSRTLKNSPSSPLQKSRNLGTFQEDFASKSSSKVRLCIDLWFKFFCYQNLFLIHVKTVILHSRNPIISKSSSRSARAKNHFISSNFSSRTETTHSR